MNRDKDKVKRSPPSPPDRRKTAWSRGFSMVDLCDPAPPVRHLYATCARQTTDDRGRERVSRRELNKIRKKPDKLQDFYLTKSGGFIIISNSVLM